MRWRTFTVVVSSFLIWATVLPADNYPGILARFPCDLSTLTGAASEPELRLEADFHPCPNCQEMRADYERDSDQKIVFAVEGTVFGEKHHSLFGFENPLAHMLGRFFALRNVFYGFPQKLVKKEGVMDGLTSFVAKKKVFKKDLPAVWAKPKMVPGYQKVMTTRDGQKMISLIDKAVREQNLEARKTMLENEAQSLISFSKSETEELAVALIRGFVGRVRTLDYKKELFLFNFTQRRSSPRKIFQRGNLSKLLSEQSKKPVASNS